MKAVTMGCIASRNGSNNNGISNFLPSKDVKAVIPGTMTSFGAKFLVPHGKRVYLAFDRQAATALRVDADTDNESSQWVITDVTNGPEHESHVVFLVEKSNKKEEQGTLLTVKDPMTQQVIFVAKPSSGEVYDAEHCLVFGIRSNNYNKNRSRNSGLVTTENLVNRQGQPIQLLVDGLLDDDEDLFSNKVGAAIFLLPNGKKNKKKSLPSQPIAR
jgi:hypothetical protein